MKKLNDKERGLCLISPSSGRGKNWEFNIGQGYICAFLKRNHIKCDIILPKQEVGIRDILNEIAQLEPAVVGFSCYDTNFFYVKIISEAIKEKFPDVLQIVGGPSTMYSYEFILNNCPTIDYLLIGEGERLSFLIMKSLNESKKIKRLPGIVYKDGNKIVYNSPLPVVNNIDLFPSPYLENIYNGNKKRIIIMTSRGCAFNCTYCNSPAYCNGKVRFHSIERVIEEIKYIAEHYKESKPQILIGDDAFTLNIPRSKKICKELITLDLQLNLMCETRADLIDDELLELLKQAGVKKIDFGLESINPRTLREIKKVNYGEKDQKYFCEQQFLEKVIHNIEYCKKIGILPMVNIIVGLPNETIEDVNRTINFVKKLEVPYSHNTLRVYEGTELNRKKHLYGITTYRSPYGLPWVTKLRYDFSKVKIDEKSINKNQLIEIKNIVKEYFTGIGEKRLNILLAYEIDEYNIEEIKRLKEQVNIHQELCVELKMEQINVILQVLSEIKVPTCKLLFFVNCKTHFEVFQYQEEHVKMFVYFNDTSRMHNIKFDEIVVFSNPILIKKIRYNILHPNIIIKDLVNLFKVKNDCRKIYSENQKSILFLLKSCWLNPSELFRILNSKKNYIRFFRHISGGVKNDSILLENFLEVVDKNIYIKLLGMI